MTTSRRDVVDGVVTIALDMEPVVSVAGVEDVRDVLVAGVGVGLGCCMDVDEVVSIVVCAESTLEVTTSGTVVIAEDTSRVSGCKSLVDSGRSELTSSDVISGSYDVISGVEDQ